MFLRTRPHFIPGLVAAIMLVGALGAWPYAYYQLLRVVVCGVAVFVVWTAHICNNAWAVWLLGIVAVLFNPLLPVHLSREMWSVIDLICAALFLLAIIVVRKQNQQ